MEVKESTIGRWISVKFFAISRKTKMTTVLLGVCEWKVGVHSTLAIQRWWKRWILTGIDKYRPADSSELNWAFQSSNAWCFLLSFFRASKRGFDSPSSLSNSMKWHFWNDEQRRTTNDFQRLMFSFFRFCVSRAFKWHLYLFEAINKDKEQATFRG